jgi:hypothetical protein
MIEPTRLARPFLMFQRGARTYGLSLLARHGFVTTGSTEIGAQFR